MAHTTEETSKNKSTTPASVKKGCRLYYEPVLWYGFWFLLITAVYWQGLVIFPKRDHSVFMLGRLLFDSDLEWFLKTLNYARTRLLFPGDTFAFRPVHMFIIALEDILFRYNLLAQGVMSSAIFSATATALFCLLRKISGNLFLALAATSLWAFQLAGAEILLWQHITPYVLLPGFFCAALNFLSDHNSSNKNLFIAGFMMFLAGLTHEIGGLIAGSLALFTLFANSTTRNKYVFTFAVGGAAALSLSAFDYFFIHKIQTFTGSADTVNVTSFMSLFTTIYPFTAASGIAMFFPSSIQAFHLENWFIGWNYETIPGALMCSGIIIVATIILATIVQTFLSLRRKGVTVLNLSSIFALALFALAYAVSAFRIITRNSEYMMSAPYYFSLLSLAITIMIAAMAVRINRPKITLCICLLLCILSVMQVKRLLSELRATHSEKQDSYNFLKNSRETIRDNSSLCFGGMDPYSTSPSHIMWHPLYQDVSCANRTGASPVYLSSNNGTSFLSSLSYYEKQSSYVDMQFIDSPHPTGQLPEISSHRFTAIIPFGHSFEVTLDRTASPFFMMTTQAGEQFGFALDYNMVKSVLNSTMMNTTILWNPKTTRTVYKVSFLRNQIILFANGLLIGTLPGVNQKTDSPVKLDIFSRTKDPVTMTKALVSAAPADATISFNPK